MLKKILIISVIVLSLLVISTSTIIAADENTITDELDDVLDAGLSIEEEVYTKNKPNVDIYQVSFSKTGTGATVTLSVNERGIIENRGNFDVLSSEEELDPNNIDFEDWDIASYSVILLTELEEEIHEYSILYINEECNLSSDFGFKDISYEIINNQITFSFELESADETYYGITSETLDISGLSLEGVNMYLDDATDLSIEIDAGGPYSGKAGENISFTGTATGGIPPYTWDWDFDDGATSTEQNPKHIYSEEGEYEVTLTVSDNYFIISQETSIVTIETTSSNGEDNNDNGDGESGMMMFLALIAVIVIAGIAVLVWFLRR